MQHLPEAIGTVRLLGDRLEPDVSFFHSGEAGGNRRQCGLARPRVAAGGNPAWEIVRHEFSIEPCGAGGHSRVDA